MKKIALVNQRYGLEVVGGSERCTRDIAELLNSHFELEVLTTCALNYDIWENYYEQGIHIVNGIKVRRFNVDKQRSKEGFEKVHNNLMFTPKSDPNIDQLEDNWVDEQGPYSPDLIDYIRKNKDEYDVFIFVTYIYYHTVRALEIVKDKAILIPTAHDEPPIYLNIYKNIFNIPKAIGFLTDEERSFVHSQFKNEHIPHDVLGYCINQYQDVPSSLFKEKNQLNDYIAYVGRVDQSKGCDELCDFFLRYKEYNPSSLKLVFIGQVVCEIPTHPDIVSLGFVSDEDKISGMAGAQVLVQSSQFESLSIVTLEALAIGTPVIVNGKSEVLRGHCIKSNAGLYYTNYSEFAGTLNYMLSHNDEYSIMRENGRKYVADNFSADVLVAKITKLINIVAMRGTKDVAE